MNPTVLVTDHGTHTASEWSKATSQAIFQIDPLMDGEALKVAAELKIIIETMMTNNYEVILNDVRATGCRGQPTPVEERAQAAAAMIGAMAATSRWGPQLGSTDWHNSAVQVIANHFSTAQQVERQWLSTTQEHI